MNARHRGVSTENGAGLDAEGPLRRWARRKREAARDRMPAEPARRRDERGDGPGPAGEVRESTQGASEPVAVEEKVLTDEDMPPLASLDENSDYSGFLSPGVSEALRRRALRKLFSSAVFNVPDGLDDYDDDFTSFAALGDIVTSDMKHQAEMEAERAKQAQARAEPATTQDGEPREVEDRRSAPASDDATAHAEAVPADGTEPPDPAAPAGPVAPDGDAAGSGERPGAASRAGGRRQEAVSDARSPGGSGAPDDVEASGGAGGEASGGEESAASNAGTEDGARASAGGEAPAKAGEAEHRGA